MKLNEKCYREVEIKKINLRLNFTFWLKGGHSIYSTFVDLKTIKGVKFVAAFNREHKCSCLKIVLSHRFGKEP